MFKPTYKYDIRPDADVFDSSEKQRVPSWTDRILCRCVCLAGLLYQAWLILITVTNRGRDVSQLVLAVLTVLTFRHCSVQLDIARYSSVSIRLSDHRPVMAVIRCRIKHVNAEKRENLAATILERLNKEMPAELTALSIRTTPSPSPSPARPIASK